MGSKPQAPCGEPCGIQRRVDEFDSSCYRSCDRLSETFTNVTQRGSSHHCSSFRWFRCGRIYSYEIGCVGRRSLRRLLFLWRRPVTQLLKGGHGSVLELVELVICNVKRLSSVFHFFCKVFYPGDASLNAASTSFSFSLACPH